MLDSDCDCDDIPMIPTVRETDIHEPERPRRRRVVRGMNQNYNPKPRKRTRKRSSSSQSDEKLSTIQEEPNEIENAPEKTIISHEKHPSEIHTDAQIQNASTVDSVDSSFDIINMSQVLENDIYERFAVGTYRIIQKVQKYGIFSKTKWYLFNHNEKIMDAKANNKNSTSIHLCRTSAASNFYDFELNSNEYHNSFVLHANGKDIFSCAFGSVRDGKLCPRFCDINNENGIWHFHTPKLDPVSGHLMLDFLGLYVCPSIRNAVVINESMYRVLNIRTIDDNTIDIDCYVPCRITTVFSMGIASFLYDK